MLRDRGLVFSIRLNRDGAFALGIEVRRYCDVFAALVKSGLVETRFTRTQFSLAVPAHRKIGVGLWRCV